jgi:ABC-2 type transport system permease protein
MTAFAIILRHEMLRLARGRWLLPLWLAFLAVGAYAAWTGAAWTAQRHAALDAIAAEERTTHQLRRTQIAEQVTPVNKSRYGGALYATAMSMRAVLPPGELAVLTVGQAEGYPMAATIFPFTASNTIFDAHLAGLENPAVLAAGRFDLAFVLVWLLPLLVLAASFDLWAHERERGMAPWLLSQPAPQLTWLLAKAAARAVVVVLPLVLLLVGMLWWAARPGLAALAQAGVLTGLYAAFWLAVAVLVNVFARTATQAALGCVGSWMALVVVLPALALTLADLAAPPVREAARVNALRASAMQARAEIRTAGLDATATATAAAPRLPAPAIPDSLRRRALEVARGEILIAAAAQPFRDQDARRQRWLNAMRAASPAIAFQDALERLAGADAGRALQFQDQAHGFLLQVRALANRYLAQDRVLTVADYDAGLPHFTFREAPDHMQLSALAYDAGIIALTLLLALCAAPAAMRRQPIHD